MPAKTGAITIMPLPNSVNELQQFLGMITNLGKFIPNLAEVTSPFCTLLKKGVEFNLQKPQLDAIWKLKLLITTTPCLKTWSTNTFEGGKLWRIRCLSATKAQNPNLPKMVPCWICITITSWLRKTLCPKKKWKGNPVHSFCCREIPWISLYTQIHSNQRSPAIKINLW